MDRLEAMAVFVAAVEAGSLSGAGRRLGIPLATVSRKLADLEEHLNTRLLTRTTRQLTLTDAGRSYVAACKRILEEVGEAERLASGEYQAPKGDLVITAPIVFGRLHVLPVVAQFLKAYPEIDIKLVLADRVMHLLEDHIDVALRIGMLPDSALVAKRVGEIREVVCASPAYLAAHGRPLAPTDLTAHQCVTFEGLPEVRTWTFAGAKADASVAIRARLSITTAEAAIDACIAGVGITRVLSYQAAAAVAAGKLEILLQDFELEPSPVHLVYAEQRLLPLKLRAFLDFAAPRLRESIPQ